MKSSDCCLLLLLKYVCLLYKLLFGISIHLALCTNTYHKSFFPKAFQSNFSCIILTSDQSSKNTARKNNYGVRKWTELGMTCDHWPGTGLRQKIGQSDVEGQIAHDKFEEFSKSAALSQHFISLLYTVFILCLHSYEGGYCLLCLVCVYYGYLAVYEYCPVIYTAPL